MTSDPPPDDNALEQLLREALAGMSSPTDAAEQVPAAVTEGSLWVHNFHDADHELARLVDSSSDTQPAGVRSQTDAPLRFEVSGYEIEIDVAARPDAHWDLSGLVLPGHEGAGRVTVADTSQTFEVDHRGQLEVQGLPSGLVFLSVEFNDGTSLRLNPFRLA